MTTTAIIVVGTVTLVWCLRKFIFQTPPILPQLWYGTLMLSQLSHEHSVRFGKWWRSLSYGKPVVLFDQQEPWEFPEAPQVSEVEEEWPDEWEVTK